MNREKLIRQVAKKSRVSRKEAEDALEATVDAIVHSLRKGEKVTLAGFGTFLVRRQAAKGASDSRTGSRIRVPGRGVPVFTPSKELAAKTRG